MWAWLSACTSPEPAPPYATTPPAPTAAPAPAPVPTVPPVPNLSEILGDCDGTFREPPRYPNQLAPGDDLHRHTLTDPDARCNDGTPGVVYVRAATDPDHLDDVVVHLQGGGECLDWLGCAERWCGSDPTYDASKMSSLWAPETTAGLGILAQNPRNTFAGWTHAFVYYCSSDSWNGLSSATPPPPAGEPAYQLERRGHTVVAATLAALRDGLTSDDGVVVLPALAPGATLLFTGTSAGSSGAMANLDFARDALPDAQVLGVFDSSLGPEPSGLPPELEANFLLLAGERWQTRLDGDALPPFGDATCLAAVPPSDAWQCVVGTHVPHGWITTPFFFRMDLRDSVMAGVFVPFGINSQGFTAGVTSALVSLGARTDAVDGTPLPRRPSVFGPACDEHLGLEAGPAFLDPRLDTPDGPLALHDALQDWLAGADVVAIDVGLDGSLCP